MRKGKGKFQSRNKYGANRGISTVWDLGRLKPVEGEQPVESSPRSIAELMHREQAAQQAKEDEQRKQENAARVIAYWGQQPASVLMASPVGVRDATQVWRLVNQFLTQGKTFSPNSKKRASL